MEMAQLMRLLGKDEKLGRAVSPTLHLAKDTPPALLLYGKEDRLLRQGEEFLQRSKEVGHRAEMFVAAGVGHGRSHVGGVASGRGGQQRERP